MTERNRKRERERQREWEGEREREGGSDDVLPKLKRLELPGK